ncbi:MAG: hypothetical protein ABIJ12_01365 [bacterium]
MNHKILNIILFIILFATLLALSCGKSNPQSSEVDDNFKNVILPLNEGNIWSFDVSRYNATGGVIEKYSIYNSIGSDTIISNVKWYSMYFYDDNSLEKYALLKNRVDGLWRRFYDESNAPFKSEELFLKYPANVDDYYLIENDTIMVTVISTDTTITVPGGTFNCYLYRFTYELINSYIISDLYFAPEIGWIKTDNYIDPETITIWCYLDNQWVLKYNLIND